MFGFILFSCQKNKCNDGIISSFTYFAQIQKFRVTKLSRRKWCLHPIYKFSALQLPKITNILNRSAYFKCRNQAMGRLWDWARGNTIFLSKTYHCQRMSKGASTLEHFFSVTGFQMFCMRGSPWFCTADWVTQSNKAYFQWFDSEKNIFKNVYIYLLHSSCESL